ncbi:Fructose dehydrogenase large subunit [Halomonas sp. THAF5a]|uniref:GMC family oxidoreductase n=1 Tax=Halomonas sp. THAF5a TaxID=2587844 RepID=UPI0012682F7C|nr:GMC family oxidoreductase [Halomonas sp. THAF5a]QFU01979.1 Fructose dehydrogenase large subunit [Halomonas sp. THAF5a]
MATRFDHDDDSVVVIIGSGAGGGTLANALAKKGINSVVLEAGKRYQMNDIENDEWEMFKKISWLDERITAGPRQLTETFPGLPAWIVKGVGGSTIHWAGVSLRFQPHEFKWHSEVGDIAGANLLDWPISYEELEPYYVKAERHMGVTGESTGMPYHQWNNNFKVLAAGAERVGYKQLRSGPMAINTEAYDDRARCMQAGFCMQGCRFGAKWSTMYTDIPRAEASGYCEVRPRSMALKIEHDDQGRATAVVYADGDGNQHRQRARAVCVAGNSIESPRLLLNSHSAMFPDGLANSSGQVGRNYMTHATSCIFGVMPKPVHMHRGTTFAGIISDEARLDPSRGFVGGYTLEVMSLGVPFFAKFMDPTNAGWGREITTALDKYDHLSGVWICGEDLPVETNGITLHDTKKDQHGLPVPVVYKGDHPNDEKLRRHGEQQARRCYEAAGAERIFKVPDFPTSHNVGTNRMSAKAQDGVVNQWGQTHDIDNLFISDGSQFTSSGAENPTLTIVALALRQADHIAERMQRQEL